MTNEEYDHWLSWHLAAFPKLKEWLGKAGDETGLLWVRALSDVSAKDACDATDMMFRGDAEAPYFSEHPAAIRKIANDLAGKRIGAAKRVDKRTIDGEPIYVCTACLDTMVVICFRPEVHRLVGQAIRDGVDPWTLFPVKVATCAYCCICDSAQRHNRKRRRADVTFDSQRDVRTTCSYDRAAFARLIQLESLPKLFPVEEPF